MSGFEGTKTLSVTSGKGGVGKTTLACNMAYELGRQGRRTLILDGDLGMANVDIMFGVRPEFNLSHVLDNRCPMSEIIIPVAPNVDLIPGGSGLYGLNQLAPMQKHLLLDQVMALNSEYDFMIIDTASGLDDSVLYLSSAAQEILVVVTPDPASLTDAYAMIKVLNQRYRETRFSVVANMVKDEAEGRFVFQRLSDVAGKFLCVSLDFKGSVPNDLILRQSVRSQQIVMQTQVRAVASQAIKGITENLKDSRGFVSAKGGLQFFWNQLSGVA